MGIHAEIPQEKEGQRNSSEPGGGGPGALAASRVVAVSCGLVQLINAGFMFEGGNVVRKAKMEKGKQEYADAAWDAKFEQLKQCEPAPRAQPVN